MKPEDQRALPGWRHFHVVAMLFVTTLIISNTIAVKVISLWGFTLPAGIITFPLAYLAGDVLTEVYGFRRTRPLIWSGFFCLGLVSLFYWLSTLLQPAAFWISDNAAFTKFFGFVPRIVLASLIAYLIGEFLNSVVMSRLKVATNGRHLWLRAIGSTVIGEGADSLIFNFTAFGGVFPTGTVAYIALSGFVLKTAYEVVALPLTYFVVAWLKRAEGIDTYDRGIKYSPI
ncbi:MAG TPA: queuosine precursor transporter [Chthoniobacterales bacterium]|nr:queuosine precursor transporter [Chthoniobacterales bacterium]